jgi:alpha-methylacyl-CoA racemase
MLDIVEAPGDEHNRAREAFVEVNGLIQPQTAPRFSRTPAKIDSPPPIPGEHTRSALLDWGLPADAVTGWLSSGAVAQHEAE